MTYRKPKSKSQGFNATALQVRKAYETHFQKPLTGSYSEAGNLLVAAMGQEEAKAFILSQSNNPNDGLPF